MNKDMQCLNLLFCPYSFHVHKILKNFMMRLGGEEEVKEPEGEEKEKEESKVQSSKKQG